MHAGGFSFPSGHSSSAPRYLTAVALHAIEHASSRSQRIVIAMVHAVLIGGVASSRVYLGVHYPSDGAGVASELRPGRPRYRPHARDPTLAAIAHAALPRFVRVDAAPARYVSRTTVMQHGHHCLRSHLLTIQFQT